jgi:hypothetical protein
MLVLLRRLLPNPFGARLESCRRRYDLIVFGTMFDFPTPFHSHDEGSQKHLFLIKMLHLSTNICSDLFRAIWNAKR